MYCSRCSRGAEAQEVTRIIVGLNKAARRRALVSIMQASAVAFHAPGRSGLSTSLAQPHDSLDRHRAQISRACKSAKRATRLQHSGNRRLLRSLRRASFQFRRSAVLRLTDSSHLGCGELYGTGGDVRLEVRNRRRARNR